MKLIISNIDWDYPGKDNGQECPAYLPSEITIEDKGLLERLLVNVDGEVENFAEYLAEEYGYCVCGFSTTVEEDEP